MCIYMYIYIYTYIYIHTYMNFIYIHICPAAEGLSQSEAHHSSRPSRLLKLLFALQNADCATNMVKTTEVLFASQIGKFAVKHRHFSLPDAGIVRNCFLDVLF